MFPWQFLLELIIHQPFILQSIRMVAIVTLFKFSIANAKEFIDNALSVIDMMKELVPANKEHRWHLFDVWFNLISALVDKIIKVHC